MNDIVYAVKGVYSFEGAPDGDGFVAEKTLKIFVPVPPYQHGMVCFAGDKNEYQFGSETVIIPPLIPHKIVNLNGNTPIEGITVAIDKPLLPLKKIDILGWCDGGGEFFRQTAGQAVYFFNDEESTGREAALAALGNLLISYILNFYPRTYSPSVKTLREDIDRHFAESTFSADAAIRKLPLNYDYVRKLFRKEIGVTPHEYLTMMRMQRAKDIILSGVTNRYTEYSVTQIAEACGYSEPLYFSRVFKKYYGVAPSDYFKKVKTKS